MGQIVISQVIEEQDRETAFAIRKAVFVDEQKFDLPLEFDGLDDDADHLLAVLDGVAVGTLRLRAIDAETAKIERVAVLKTARGCSVGAALVKAACHHLGTHGVRHAKLHAQTHAVEFYAKLGFVAYGAVFDEDDIPHRAMRAELD